MFTIKISKKSFDTVVEKDVYGFKYYSCDEFLLHENIYYTSDQYDFYVCNGDVSFCDLDNIPTNGKSKRVYLLVIGKGFYKLEKQFILLQNSRIRIWKDNIEIENIYCDDEGKNYSLHI